MFNLTYNFRDLSLSLMLLLFVSCSTSPRLVVSSAQKDVSFSIFSQNTLKKNGLLPLEDDLIPLFSGSEMIEIEFSSLGYQSKRLVLPKANFIKQVKIDVSLDKVQSSAVGEVQIRDLMNSKNLDELVKEITSFQSLLSNRRFDEANAIAKRLSDQYPRTSAFYDLQGNISYLKGNLSSALSLYLKAEELNPGNQERDQIINTIQGAIR